MLQLESQSGVITNLSRSPLHKVLVSTVNGLHVGLNVFRTYSVLCTTVNLAQQHVTGKLHTAAATAIEDSLKN